MGKWTLTAPDSLKKRLRSIAGKTYEVRDELIGHLRSQDNSPAPVQVTNKKPFTLLPCEEGFLSLGEDFLNAFRAGYAQSSLVREYYRLKHATREAIGGRWTGAMEEVLAKIAGALGIDRQEKRSSPDYLWFKKDRLLVAIEHENEFNERKILDAELQSLLRTETSLRVLITYPPKILLPANEMAMKLEEELSRRLTPEKNSEFIFLASPKEWATDPAEEVWMYYLWQFQLNRTQGHI